MRKKWSCNKSSKLFFCYEHTCSHTIEISSAILWSAIGWGLTWIYIRRQVECEVRIQQDILVATNRQVTCRQAVQVAQATLWSRAQCRHQCCHTQYYNRQAAVKLANKGHNADRFLKNSLGEAQLFPNLKTNHRSSSCSTIWNSFCHYYN